MVLYQGAVGNLRDQAEPDVARRSVGTSGVVCNDSKSDGIMS